jgi:hypothetical protein
MDWDSAIKRNSEALKGIIEALFALLGLDGTDMAGRIPRSVHSAVLRVLRPAESAVRRLIVIAARGLVVKLKPVASRPMPKLVGPIGKSGGQSHPSFQLFDQRKNFKARRRGRRVIPRLHVFGNDDAWGNHPTVASLWAARRPMALAAPAPPSDGLVGAERLTRRLQALKLALEDLPRQARRLARWRLRRANMPSAKFQSPLRPGPPPGRRKEPVHPIDEILTECHWLAWEAEKPDTS